MAPPTRHPIPVGYVPELQVGDEVTIGVPGHYFIDGQVVAQAERRWASPVAEADAEAGAEEQEVLAVVGALRLLARPGRVRAGREGAGGPAPPPLHLRLTPANL